MAKPVGLLAFCFSALLLALVGHAAAADTAGWKPTKCGPGDLLTQWGKQVDPNNVLPEYPRYVFPSPCAFSCVADVYA